MDEDRVENGKCLPLPPDEIQTLIEMCFSEAKDKLALFRKRTILRNLHHAHLESKTNPQQAINRDGTHNRALITDDNALKSLNAICAVPSASRSKKVMQNFNRCPNGLAWIRVRTNMRAADKGKDNFFVPYIGESDAHQNFSNKLAAETFEDDKRAPEDVSDDEASQSGDDDVEDVPNTDFVVEKRNPVNLLHKHTPPRQSSISEQIISTPNPLCSPMRKKVSDPVWERAGMRVALRQVVRKLNCASVQPFAAVVCDVFGLTSTDEVLRCFQNVKYREAKYEEMDREKHVRANYRTEMLRILDGSLMPTPTEILNGDSIPFFICRQCYTYNCFLHGNQTAKPSRPIPDRTRKDSTTRQLSTKIENNCEDRAQDKCWYVSQHVHECTSWWRSHARDTKKAEDVRAVVQELCHVFGADPCRVSSACKTLLTTYYDDLDLTCCRIGYLFDVFGGIRQADSSLKTRRRMRKSFRVDSSKSKRQKMRMEDESGLRGGLRRDFEPCQHSGPCNSKSCPCVQNGVNCEKYCACNHTRSHRDRADRRLTCANAFKGCTCRSALACVSNACVCYSWKRECDPDLCRACHECKGGRNEKSCRNVGLLLGKRKRIVVGHSDTHGWGAFASGNIAKNEVIGEYVGEIVDQEHADRRGQLYDEVQYSFLFNITDDFALDSTRIGNKLRFCNHAFDPNCEARLMRVAGDIRVGLYAKKDIGKHEELFFDYKYKFGPDWAVPEKKANSSQRYKTKQRNAPTAMKTATSNEAEKRGSSPAFDSGPQESDEFPYNVEIKPARNMKVSTRSQRRNESPPMKLQRVQANNMIHQNSNHKSDENQASRLPKTEKVVHKVERAPRRPLSIWRGVLKRVAPRAADAISPDDLPPTRTHASNVRGSASEQIQECRDASEKNQLASGSNDVKRDVSRKGSRIYSEGYSEGFVAAMSTPRGVPYRYIRGKPDSRSPAERDDGHKRLRYVSGSDQEKNDEDREERPSVEPSNESASEKVQLASSSNDVKPDTSSNDVKRDTYRKGCIIYSEGYSGGFVVAMTTPRGVPYIEPGSRSARKPRDRNKRLRVLDSVHETDDGDRDENPSVKPSNEKAQGVGSSNNVNHDGLNKGDVRRSEGFVAAMSTAKGAPYRNVRGSPPLDCDRLGESVSLPAKRHRSGIDNIDAPQLKRELQTKKQKASASVTGANSNAKSLKITRDNLNSIRRRFVSNRKAKDSETAKDGHDTSLHSKTPLSPSKKSPDSKQTNGVVAHGNRQPEGNALNSTRNRSGPSSSKGTRTESRENVDRERSNRSSRKSANGRGRSQQDHEQRDSEEREIPMVNLVSDDDSQASSGSFNPGLFKWLR